MIIVCEQCKSREITINEDVAKCDVCGHYTKIVYVEYRKKYNEENKMEEVKSVKEVNESEMFDKKNIAEASGFFKFKKIGDRVFGTLVSLGEVTEGKTGFKDQKLYHLKNARGTQDGERVTFESVRVGIPVDRIVVISKADKALPGDSLGFEYHNDYQTPENKKKGFAPAKSIEVYITKGGRK